MARHDRNRKCSADGGQAGKDKKKVGKVNEKNVRRESDWERIIFTFFITYIVHVPRQPSQNFQSIDFIL